MEKEDQIPGPDDPANALCGGKPITRKATDGTTVVFYSFAGDARLKEMQNAPREIEMAHGKIPDPSLPLSPADEQLQKHFKDAFHQVEGIANIRFYNYDHLNGAAKKALAAQGIDVPARSDMEISEIDFPKNCDNTGMTEICVNKGDVPMHLAVSRAFHQTPSLAPYVKTTVLHEVMHALGFEHSFTDENDKEPKAPFTKLTDHRGNTVLSYNRYDGCGTEFAPQVYQKYDIQALQTVYGPSRNPTPNLLENLQADENRRMGLATQDLETALAHPETLNKPLPKPMPVTILTDMPPAIQRELERCAKQQAALSQMDPDMVTTYYMGTSVKPGNGRSGN